MLLEVLDSMFRPGRFHKVFACSYSYGVRNNEHPPIYRISVCVLVVHGQIWASCIDRPASRKQLEYWADAMSLN